MRAGTSPYGGGTAGEFALKMTLDGNILLSVSASAIPDQFKDAPRNKDENGTLNVWMAGLDVAPNGDLYASDGYASDYIHRFDRTGKYLASFGGKKEPTASAGCTISPSTRASRRRGSSAATAITTASSTCPWTARFWAWSRKTCDRLRT